MRASAASILAMSLRCLSRALSSSARSVSDVARSARSACWIDSSCRPASVSRVWRMISSFQATQLLAEVEPLALVHERLVLGGTIVGRQDDRRGLGTRRHLFPRYFPLRLRFRLGGRRIPCLRRARRRPCGPPSGALVLAAFLAFRLLMVASLEAFRDSARSSTGDDKLHLAPPIGGSAALLSRSSRRRLKSPETSEENCASVRRPLRAATVAGRELSVVVRPGCARHNRLASPRHGRCRSLPGANGLPLMFAGQTSLEPSPP